MLRRDWRAVHWQAKFLRLFQLEALMTTETIVFHSTHLTCSYTSGSLSLPSDHVTELLRVCREYTNWHLPPNKHQCRDLTIALNTSFVVLVDKLWRTSTTCQYNEGRENRAWKSYVVDLLYMLRKQVMWFPFAARNSPSNSHLSKRKLQSPASIIDDFKSPFSHSYRWLSPHLW